MAQTNVLNELYAMQHEPQEQMLDWNINNNVEPISYDPMENYYSNPYNQGKNICYHFCEKKNFNFRFFFFFFAIIYCNE